MTNAIKERASLAQMLVWLLLLLSVSEDFSLSLKLGEHFEYVFLPLTVLMPFVAAAAAQALGRRVWVVLALFLPLALISFNPAVRFPDGWILRSVSAHFSGKFLAYLLSLAAVLLVLGRPPVLSRQVLLALVVACFALAAIWGAQYIQVPAIVQEGIGAGWRMSLAAMPAAVCFCVAASRRMSARSLLLTLSALLLGSLIFFDGNELRSPGVSFDFLGWPSYLNWDTSQYYAIALLAIAATLAGSGFASARDSRGNFQASRRAALLLSASLLLAGVGAMLLFLLEVFVIRTIPFGDLVAYVSGDQSFAGRSALVPLSGEVSAHLSVAGIAPNLLPHFFMIATFIAGLIADAKWRWVTIIGVVAFYIAGEMIYMQAHEAVEQLEKGLLYWLEDGAEMYLDDWHGIYLLALIVYIAGRRIARRLTQPLVAA